MLATTDATLVAQHFGLGARAVLDGPVAFGRLGEIWRLVTEQGRFAVKHARFAVSVEDAERDAAYQDIVRAAGVPMPAVVRTVDGAVLANLEGGTVRVYEWVDILPADRSLDPGELGRALATIHSVVVPTDEPVDDERWLSSTTDGDRASNADWVAEFLDEPVTVETVDRILLAVNDC